MKLDPAIRDQVLATVPSLRAFAISLCGNIDRGDDLVQETLLRALTHIDSFKPGTNLAAWLFTILRNQFREEYRKRQREVEDADGRYAETLISHPEQTGRIEFEELRAALMKLPSEQREALILVGASGYSYDDAAAICGCPAGTIKSRVNRARIHLADLLAIDGVSDLVELSKPRLSPVHGNVPVDGQPRPEGYAILVYGATRSDPARDVQKAR
jgi:RNA polymerase sigma-70 factor, ECF subfamily